MHPHAATARLTMERLLLFTDAVFAIILTLLALEIRVPDGAALHTSRDVFNTLASMGSQFGSYVLGFAVIALVWNVHLRRYRFAVAVSGKVIALNMIQLLCVGLIPFATSLLSRGVNSLIVSIYAGIVLASSLISWAAWTSVTRNPTQIGDDYTPVLRRQDNTRSATIAVIFLLSIFVSWWSPILAMWVWALQLPANFLLKRLR